MTPRRKTAAAAAFFGVAACAAPTAPRPAAFPGTLRGAPLPLLDDPTVRQTRLVPADLREAHRWGAELGGGVRATVSGVRVLQAADALLSATDRLPAAPSAVVAVPDRMGGGFLFVVGTLVWRSDTWLGPLRPLLRSQSPIGDVLVGLDRAYLFYPTGTLAAFDPRTGAAEDLGALPASPRMGRLAALDAWRAVAVVDLRGALVTLDAGSSWRPLDIASEPVEPSIAAGAMLLRSVDASRQTQWWEIERDGQAIRVPSPPAAPPGAEAPPRAPGPLGPDALAAAIEDGWPLADGTVLVARDGCLFRVRLDDGAVLASAPDAFPLRPARCHRLPLATRADPRGFGFVCGEPRGATAIYRWDPGRSGLAAIRSFEDPRQILAFGNGALAARGPCEGREPQGDELDRSFCVMTARGQWTERRFRGDRVDRARIAVLADGRVALVRPPDGDLATARLTLSDGVSSEHVELRFPLLRDDVAKALLHGVWLDGLEERRPGILGGWVDAAGAVVGIEIALDGAVRVGEYIRDAGAPVAAGRWAFGWTASRRAFETTDGGMTWTKDVDVPEPIAAAGATRERACGPVGCIAAGWLKVGWTSDPPEPPAASPPALLARPQRSPPALRFVCDRLAPEPAGEPASSKVHAPGPRPAFGQPYVLAPGAPMPGFCGRSAPPRASDAPAVVAEIVDGVGWPRRASPAATVYAWGPPSGEWDREGRWEVRWRSPWGGCGAASGPAPWATAEAAAHALGRAGGGGAPLVLVSGDEAGRALLAARRPGGFALLGLETGRPPREIRRADGDLFADLEGATQSGGRWYVVSAQAAGQLAATVLWQVEGDLAREIARLPRAGPEGRSNVHLARRLPGRAVGVVVEGRPDAAQPASLWVEAVDPETGEVGEPEPLAPLDLGGRAPPLCTGDDEGWEVDLPYAGNVELDLGAAGVVPVVGPVVTWRLSGPSACVARAWGAGGDDVKPVPAGQAARLPFGRLVDVGLVNGKVRLPFRCRFP